ncbi:MAG: HNH endonuclease [Methylobacter sp.]|uniref:HNH endonuclease n=1 Tax=Candidatus Methylobacter titanis TaxID=3053457 RepID=A0AA43Q7L6_9GAMM|nr:HNH endonuclease [Candidatus Methylobacter titanis]MDI1292886.1 HNH endonuclease [Candidatus Methylobacter titanis]
MNIWRLIAHHDHEEADEAIDEMKRSNRIAIGWSKIGNLSKLNISNQSEISSLIKKSYPHIDNAHLGGPSLWNIYNKMREGDLVIVNANGKRVCVFEVTGPYIFEQESGEINGYAHQRSACLTSINPESLWNSSGSAVAPGQNIRWTLAACTKSEKAEEAIYKEGSRFSVTSTAIERNPFARQKCIEHFGAKCFVCGIEFKNKYGDIGKEYIHVHHRVDISTKSHVHEVDPLRDLIPLCPNCHAMAHQKKPAIPVEELKKIYEKHNVSQHAHFNQKI